MCVCVHVCVYLSHVLRRLCIEVFYALTVYMSCLCFPGNCEYNNYPGFFHLFHVYTVPFTFIRLVCLSSHTTHRLSSPSHAPSALVWSFIFSLYFPRICAIFIIVKIFLLKNSLQPTVVAKVFLLSGFVLSFVDHLPSSVTTVAPYAQYKHAPSNEDCTGVCVCVCGGGGGGGGGGDSLSDTCDVRISDILPPWPMSINC